MGLFDLLLLRFVSAAWISGGNQSFEPAENVSLPLERIYAASYHLGVAPTLVDPTVI